MTHSEADLTLADAASFPDSATVRHRDAVIDCAKSAEARRRALRRVVSRIREVAGLHRGAQSKRRRASSDWRASGCVTEARRRTSSGCVDRPSSVPIRMSPTCGGVHDRRRSPTCVGRFHRRTKTRVANLRRSCRHVHVERNRLRAQDTPSLVTRADAGAIILNA